MSKNIYALLVGINTYPSPVAPLFGCENDIQAFRAYLEKRAGGSGYTLPPPCVLLNEQATRQAVIDSFRQQFQRAAPGDIALFYYSGHGSQEHAPEQFWGWEPDRLNETLVLYDSRLPDGYDLADKELAFLIAEVAGRGAQVVVILDSCHSGSATRAAWQQQAVRWIPPADTAPRPPESYLFWNSGFDVARALPAKTNPSGWMNLPRGRHILLAACSDHETAKETSADGQPRGAFSYFLLETLTAASSALTYREAFKQAQARVRASIHNQTPQIESTQPEDANQPFLGGAIRPRPVTFTVSFDGNTWKLDAGAVHGIPSPQGGESAALSLYPLDADEASLSKPGAALGLCHVVQVFADSSRVEMDDFEPDPERTYKALLVGLPLPSIGVCLAGDAKGVAAAQKALQSAGPNGSPSLYVRLNDDAPLLRLLAEGDAYWISYASEKRSLTASIARYDPESARKAVQRLEHIARWLRLKDLSNPLTALLTGALSLRVLQDGQSLDETALHFEQTQGRDGYSPVPFDIEITNRGERPLYVSLLGLWETFGVDVLHEARQEPVTRLEKAQKLVIPLETEVPENVWRQGQTRLSEIYKVIACTEPFEAQFFGQPELDRPLRSVMRGKDAAPAHTLERLGQHIQTRGRVRTSDPYADWTTLEVVVEVTRPPAGQPLPAAGQKLALNQAVTLHGHPSLQAHAGLIAAPPIQRDLERPRLPAILAAEPQASQPFFLRPAMRDARMPESILELSQVSNPAAVTAENPLQLEITLPLKPGESVLPYGYDGEFYLPLGAARRTPQGLSVEIRRLPPPLSQGTRDVVGTVRIYFHKVIGQPLGLPYPYPVLAHVTIDAAGNPQYNPDPAHIRQQVATAENITLYIHGFSGDTQGMAASSRHTNPNDLILAFDYESVNTSIEETARALKQRLEAVGLKAGHGKNLRMVAHSLGGVISRWFIEREGGSQIVKKLIICGSPSAGTPWPTIQQWATVGIGLALNGMTAVAWPMKALGWLLNAFETIDVTLDQIQPNSEFLRSLAASPDPKTEYILLAGNTALIPENANPEQVKRLLARLGYGAASLAFFNLPNDIAISVPSVHAVDDQRQPAPYKHILPCDHMSYFDSPAGQEALRQALGA